MKRYVLVVVLLGCLFVYSSAVGVSQGWEQYQGDSRNTGVYDGTSVGDSWKYESRATVTSTAVRSGGRLIFIDSSGSLYALDASSGERLWVQRRNYSVYKSPIVDGTNIYFGERDGRIYAFDRDGRVRWVTDTGKRTTSSPAVGKDTVYIGAGRSVRAVRDDDGKVIWETNRTEGAVVPPIKIGDFLYVSAFERGSETEAVGSLTKMGTDGEVDWVFTDEGVLSPPSIGESVIYTGNWNGEVYAIDKSDGSVIWESDLGGMISAPTLADGKVYYGVENGTLYALDKSDGTVEWEFDGVRRMDFSPAVTDERVYATSLAGVVYSLRPSDGEEVWSVSVGEKIFASPTVADGTVYVSSGAGVYALNNATLDSLEGVSRNFSVDNLSETEPNVSDTNRLPRQDPDVKGGGGYRNIDTEEERGLDNAGSNGEGTETDTSSDGNDNSQDDGDVEEEERGTDGGSSEPIPPVFYPFIFGLLLMASFFAYFVRQG